jgi:uncharacterized membrane protein YwaF
MTWGTFTPTHLASLASVGLFYVIMEWSLKRLPEKTQIWILGLLSLTGFAAGFYNLTTWGSPWEYLPLHLCSLNALVLPIAVFTRSKALGNLLLAWCLGALAALVVNMAQAEYEIFSLTFVFYFFPHVLEFGIPILLFKLGLIEMHPKYILSTLGITMAIYTGIHLFNVWLNGYCEANQILDYAGNVIRVNYMYSITPENPLLVLFKQVIPYDYWYMYMIVPILAVYLSIVYAPVTRRIVIRKRRMALAHA